MMHPSSEILERISDAFVALDSDWRYHYVNAKAGELFGRDPQSLIGVHIWTAFPEGLGSAFHHACEQASREQVSTAVEDYIEPWDRWMEGRIHPSPEGLSVFFTDITDRKRQEQAVQESEDRAQQMAERMRAIAETASGVLGARTFEELDQVLRQACTKVLPHDVFTFGLYDEGEHTVHFISGCEGGVIERGETVSLAGKPGERVLRERRSLLTFRANDPAAQGAQPFGSMKRSESIVRTPILSRDRVLGLITVQSYTPDFYTNEEVEVLETLAAVLASAIENIELLEHKEAAHAALQESEERYRLAMRATSDVIWDWDVQADRGHWGDALSAVFGYSAEDAGTNQDWWAEKIHPEDRERVLTEIRAAVDGIDGSWSGEYRFRCSDGSYAVVRDYSYIQRDEAGVPRRVTGSMRDITESQRAEQALRHRERQLAEAQAVAHVGSWEWDLVRDVAVWSDEHYRIVGLEPQSVPMNFERFQEFLHPDDREPIQALFATALRERSSFECEERIIRPDGEMRIVHARGRVITDQAGTPVRVLGTAQDITERKRAEEALRQSEARFRRLVESAPDAIAVHDLEGRYVEANEAACRLWGYAREELLTSVRASDIDPTCTPERLQALWPELRETGAYAVETQTQKSDGTLVPVEVRIVPLDHDPQRPLILGIIRDIRQRKELEEQLRQAQKMEAVGQLAGGVAHDFNNMLTAIRGFAELLEPDVKGSADAEMFLREIQRAAERSSDLTRQLLAFGRKQVLQPRLLDVGDVVRDAERLLRRLIPLSIDIEMDLAARAGQVNADPAQIQQVLLNLAINARDAVREGGGIRIMTREQRVSSSRRGHVPQYVRPGHYVALVVQDTGCGMDQETLSRVFEPFFTRKPQGEGTGLGLATVYGIVKQSGGYIWAESAVGEGSTFTVLLPRADSTGAHEEAYTPACVLRGTGTVLLVEDEDVVRRLARHTLHKAGYTVIEAADGEEAIRAYEQHAGDVDLLLTDVVMPKMGGKALSALLRQHRPELPVVLMSGYAGDVLTDEESLPHGMEFFQKPFVPAALAEVVMRVLDRARA